MSAQRNPVDANRPQTTMAAAFKAAGVEPAQDKLLRVGIDAWAKFPGFGGDTARRNHVADQLRGEMTYALFDDYDRSELGAAIGWLLLKSEKVIVGQRPDTAKAVGGGQRQTDIPNGLAPSTTSRDDAGPQASRRSGPAASPSAPHTATRAAPNLTLLADKHAARAAASVKTEISLSRLDTFVINGQKIGDLTPAEANAWAGSRERDARFVRLLTANLPPDRPIREFIKGQEADELYARAEAANAE